MHQSMHIYSIFSSVRPIVFLYRNISVYSIVPHELIHYLCRNFSSTVLKDKHAGFQLYHWRTEHPQKLQGQSRSGQYQSFRQKGGVCDDTGAFGLREDHFIAFDCRFSSGDIGTDFHRREGDYRHSSIQTSCQYGFSEICIISAFKCIWQYRFRFEAEKTAAQGDWQEGGTGSQNGKHDRLWIPFGGFPLRRPAATGSHCEGYCEWTGGALAGWTSFRPGPENEAGHANGVERVAQEFENYIFIRNTRPGGGADTEWHGSRNERRGDTTNGHPHGCVQRACQFFCSGLHRCQQYSECGDDWGWTGTVCQPRFQMCGQRFRGAHAGGCRIASRRHCCLRKSVKRHALR